jgi:hypothetical protein
MSIRLAPRKSVALWPALIAIVPFILLSIHTICQLQFDCGCTPLWRDGTEHCNIHTPGVPHCPWCYGGILRAVWVGAIVLGATAVGLARASRRNASGRETFLHGVVGYLLGALLAGLIAALVTGYPHWLGIPLR